MGWRKLSIWAKRLLRKGKVLADFAMVMLYAKGKHLRYFREENVNQEF